MGLPTPWVRHLRQGDQEAQSNFEGAIRNATVAIQRLREILQEELDQLDRQESSDSQFDKPNWEYLQAYRNGQRSKLRGWKQLLTFDQEI